MIRRLTSLLLFATSGMLRAQTGDLSFLHDHFADFSGDTVVESMVVEMVNAERLKFGLPMIKMDARLRSAARQHSFEMLTRGYFSHTSPTPALKEPIDRVYRTGTSDGTVGENIAYYAYDTSASAVAEKFMDLWMNSPGHRANILRPEFNYIGVGVTSRVDSQIVDTLIGRSKIRHVRRTIHHYATQNFVFRYLTFQELHVTQRDVPMLTIDVVLRTDRSIMARLGRMTVIRAPEASGVRLKLSAPSADTLTLSLAYLENDYTQEFVRFFHEPMTKDRRTLSGILSTTRIRGSIRDFSVLPLRQSFIRAEGMLERSGEQDLFLYFNKTMYFQYVTSNGFFSINEPLMGDGSLLIEWALGHTMVRPVTNRLHIDLTALRTMGNHEGDEKKIFLQDF